MGQVNFKTAQEQAEEKQQATKRKLTEAVQSMMDLKAQERGYDGILSLCSYATDSDPVFSAEGQAGVEWRGNVWRAAYNILSDVESGARPIPTESELIGELPEFNWPAV